MAADSVDGYNAVSFRVRVSFQSSPGYPSRRAFQSPHVSHGEKAALALPFAFALA